MSRGVFAEWQPRYAEHGIPTFPVCGKKPAVRGYLRVGLPASSELAAKFENADAFGFALRPAGIAVVDVDTPDERVLAEALDHYGPTPIVIRSGSGHFQAWYRRQDEGRRIRPDPKLPIDILGTGYVVAPPSAGPRRLYEIIQGTLADLPHLPTLKNRPAGCGDHERAVAPDETRDVGSRNTTLWRHCMAEAHFCDDFDSLLDVARTRNAQFNLPLDDAEVLKAARSAWGYTERGQNLVGRQHVRIAYAVIDELLTNNSDAYLLLTLLLRHNADQTRFPVANAMAEAMPPGGWALKRFRSARSSLLDLGFIVCVRGASSYCGAALYTWGSKR
jgi:hypothetical protein